MIYDGAKTEPVNVRSSTHTHWIGHFLLAAVSFHLFVLYFFIPPILTIILCSVFSGYKMLDFVALLPKPFAVSTLPFFLLFHVLISYKMCFVIFSVVFPPPISRKSRERIGIFWSIVNIFMNNVCSINGCGQSEPNRDLMSDRRNRSEKRRQKMHRHNITGNRNRQTSMPTDTWGGKMKYAYRTWIFAKPSHLYTHSSRKKKSEPASSSIK